MRTLTMRSAATTLAALAVGFSAAAAAEDRNEGDRFSARLSGYNEVHFIAGVPALRGAISTQARGSFRAVIDDRAETIHYELSFEGLESDVTQSHIHFGQRHTVGGIVVWLCQTAGTPAPVERLRAALVAFGKDGQSMIHVYDGMPHAFNADYRPSYRKEAADDGWKRMLAWFKKNGVA